MAKKQASTARRQDSTQAAVFEKTEAVAVNGTFNHAKALRGLVSAVRRALGGNTPEAIDVIATELGLLMEVIERDHEPGPACGRDSNAIQIALGSIKDRLELISALRGYDPDAPAGNWWSNVVDYRDSAEGAS